MKYIVGVREVHVAYKTIEADSEAEAKEKVFMDLSVGEYDEYLEYSHTLDKGTWSVEPKEESNDG